jgi:hypothetical protein
VGAHYNDDPRRMLIKLLALLGLLVLLWSLFRLAMGLRWAKVSRESARGDEERRGRRIVAELPDASGALGFFAEDHGGFYWPAGEAAKSEVVGARLLLNGGIIASAARPGVTLAEPATPEPFEGRERWDVAMYLSGGARLLIECGTVREGVSREIATRVFDAVKAELAAPRRPRAEPSWGRAAGGTS